MGAVKHCDECGEELEEGGEFETKEGGVYCEYCYEQITDYGHTEED